MSNKLVWKTLSWTEDEGGEIRTLAEHMFITSHTQRRTVDALSSSFSNKPRGARQNATTGHSSNIHFGASRCHASGF